MRTIWWGVIDQAGTILWANPYRSNAIKVAKIHPTARVEQMEVRLLNKSEPCKTCGGTGVVTNSFFCPNVVGNETKYENPCPDCPDSQAVEEIRAEVRK